MGNAPSNPGNESNEAVDSVDSVTFTNNSYQKQQPYHHNQQQQHQPNQHHRQLHGSPHLQQPSYMASTHQHHALSSEAFTHSSPPQGSIHPSTIPIASIPVDAAQRPRFPSVREQYLNDSPAGSSPLDSDSSYPHVPAAGREHSRGDPTLQPQPRSTHIPKDGLPGGGPRRRASSLVSGQSYGQYTDTFNEQALLASAAQQDKLEHRLHTADGRASYRNSARVSRAFESLEPLKSLDNAHDGNLMKKQAAYYCCFLKHDCIIVGETRGARADTTVICLFCSLFLSSSLADYRHCRFKGWKRTHDHYMESGRHQCLRDRNFQQLETESTAQQKVNSPPNIFYPLIGLLH